MNENIEKRKRELVNYLNDEYSPRPQKWWQIRQPEYENTSEVARRSRDYRPTQEDTVIKYDLKGALKGSALFLCVSAGMFTIFEADEKKFDAGVLFWMMLITIIITVPVLKELKGRPKIIMNREGLWLHILEAPVPWKNIAATYIKNVDQGESTAHFLVIHYYLEQYDSFAVTAYKLENLTVKKEDLAAEIEYRKMNA
jgi:hypothetical protein